MIRTPELSHSLHENILYRKVEPEWRPVPKSHLQVFVCRPVWTGIPSSKFLLGYQKRVFGRFTAGIFERESTQFFEIIRKAEVRFCSVGEFYGSRVICGLATDSPDITEETILITRRSVCN